jgi:hypothetical protein
MQASIRSKLQVQVNKIFVDIGAVLGDPDPHVFWPPGSGSVSHRYGLAFSHKSVEQSKTMLAK